ncbi:hypothetical protein ACIBF5_10045 [Micromonospora sp. NPDC050417]|uniref:hypothetical protein n=1 Tax=Micromonospora sp. NPDC050417 TaxID=3364280 RepID=UPI003787BE54
MGVYHGGDQIELAQQTLELHTVSSANGHCMACGVPGPCAAQEQATKVFLFALRLPRRIPGLTRPELIGARQMGLPGLLPRAS